MRAIGDKNLELIIQKHTSDVRVFTVDAGATNLLIPLKDVALLVNYFVGYLVIGTGALAGEYAIVESSTADEFTLMGAGFSGAPVEDSEIIVIFNRNLLASQLTLSELNNAIGDEAAALVDAGDEGTVSSKLRRLTADLALLAGYFNTGNAKVTLEKSISEWSEIGTSADNTAVTINRAAEADKRHYITAFEVVIRGAAAGNDIKVELLDGATVMWTSYIGEDAPRGERIGIAFAHGLEMSVNTEVSLAVEAGGAGVIAEVNMAGYTI